MSLIYLILVGRDSVNLNSSKIMCQDRGRGALSSISIAIERASPLSSAMYTIYPALLCICMTYYFSVISF